MVKVIEKAGIPVAHITNMTPVAKVTGSNRIVPGIAITNPTSDVSLPLADQLKMRRDLVQRALSSLAAELEEAEFF